MDHKVIEFVLKHSVDDIVKSLQGRSDKSKIIHSLKFSRTDYGMKVQSIIEKLEGKE